MKKFLVAYFSATGTTKQLAETLSSVISADLFEIKPLVSYTQSDLDWTNKNSRSSIEMNDTNSRPKIEGKIKNIDDYDVIFIGFPIWWYTFPKIINTFLDSYDFSNKTIIPFATSGESDIEKANDEIHKYCSSVSTIKSGKRFGSFDANSLKQWVDSLDV